jgi:enoyl-CoA hydratase/carnithine racemase
MTGHIIVTDEESTRTIVMRRPEKKNALTEEMFLALSDAINSAQSNPDIRCFILTGRSGVFSAGVDIEDFLKAATEEHDPANPRNSAIFLRALVNNKKPIIAAVDGIAQPRHFHPLLFNTVSFRKEPRACCCREWPVTSARSRCW